MNFKIAIASFLLLSTFNAFAASSSGGSNKDSYFEPYVGANVATFKQKFSKISGTVNGVTITSASADLSGDFGGFTGGLRVYKKFLGQFIIGGDATLSISSGKIAMDVLYPLGKYDLINLSPGLIVGWDIPTFLLPRIWGGIYLDSMSLTQKGSSSTSADKYGGHSFKAGVSFDWWIQLGFEVSKHQYTTLNSNKFPYTSTQSGLTATQEKVDYEEYILTISYPFEL